MCGSANLKRQSKNKPLTFICQDFPRCDLLIIMGTSLQVQPFASLVSRYDNCLFVYRNLCRGTKIQFLMCVFAIIVL